MSKHIIDTWVDPIASEPLVSKMREAGWLVLRPHEREQAPVGVQHIWSCSCGVQSPCEFEDLCIGGYFRCPSCGESAVGLVSKSGRKVFIALYKASVDFNRLFDPPETEEDEEE